MSIELDNRGVPQLYFSTDSGGSIDPGLTVESIVVLDHAITHYLTYIEDEAWVLKYSIPGLGERF